MLPEMEELFALFSAVRSLMNAFKKVRAAVDKPTSPILSL
jgi:hypothetical protein